MKLEQVLPQLREGQTITRSKAFQAERNTILFVKIEQSKLKFKCIWSNGDEINWAYYRFRTEDVMAENWEVAG
jgi:hypothetical protein